MKVKDLKDIIQRLENEYDDALEWDVAYEIVRDPEGDVNCREDIISHYDEMTQSKWEFLKSHSMGCATTFIYSKCIGLQVHF